MIPSAANSDYPKFVADQVLTSDNLNDLFGYLDEQGRLTRTNLLGIGIVCGLEIKTANNGRSITITKGVGVTSSGYLVSVPEVTYTKRSAAIFDAVKCAYYSKFVNISAKTQKFDLWELKQEAEAEGTTSLEKSFLEDGEKIVLIFVELLEENNKNCDPNSCDDKGINVTVNFRPLLVGKANVAGLLAGTGSSTTPWLSLPALNMRRFDITATPLFECLNFYQAYQSVLTPEFLKQTNEALSKSYDVLKQFLTDDFSQDPFANLNENFKFLTDGSIHPDQLMMLQYYYDLFSDIIMAYNEFRKTGLKVIGMCCPDDIFPRHLLLGPAMPGLSGEGTSYRHYFIPSPILSDQKKTVTHLKILFRKLVLLIKSFSVPAPDVKRLGKGLDNTIRITPSKLGDVPLSNKSIPYYYSINDASNELLLNWDPEKYLQGISHRNLSYHAIKYNPIDDDIRQPLLYDLEPYNFLRIEGHIGKHYQHVVRNISALRDKNRLPFNLVALSADISAVKEFIQNLGRLLTTGGSGSQATLSSLMGTNCHFNDLELLYDSIMAELTGKLSNEMKFFYNLNRDGQRTPLEKPQSNISQVLLLVKADTTFRFRTNSIGHEFELYYPIVKDQPFISLEILFSSFGQDGNTDVMDFVFKAILYYIEMLYETVTTGLSNFHFYNFYTRYFTLIQTIKYIKLLNNLNNERFPLSEEENDHLDALLSITADTRMQQLYLEFLRRILQVKVLQNAGFYLRSHPGIQHKAGVPMGGTFILIYHEESIPQTDQRIPPVTHVEGRPMPEKRREFFRDNKEVAKAKKDRERIMAFRTKSNPTTQDQLMIMSLDVGQKMYFLKDQIVSKLEKNIQEERVSPDNTHSGPNDFQRKTENGESSLKTGFEDVNQPLVSYLLEAERYLETRKVDKFDELIEDFVDGAVIADFYLPYNCCSDCPSVQMIISGESEKPNQPPVARPGDNVSVQLPNNTVTLDGSSSSDPDGVIKSYLWEKKSGPEGDFEFPEESKVEVSNLKEGVYEFKLTVTDDDGATDSGVVTITVLPIENKPPVAIAKAEPSEAALSDNNEAFTKLIGSESHDEDGEIKSFEWSLSSGPSNGHSIEDAGKDIAAVKFTKAGIYIFKLVVKDDKGATDSATTTVVVNRRENKPPVPKATASPDRLTIVPGQPGSVTLDSAGSIDPDGTIKTFQWSVLTGGTGARIVKSGDPKTTVEFSQPGNYVIQLTVIDDAGATASANVSVTVSREEVPLKKCASLKNISDQFKELRAPENAGIIKAFRDSYSFFQIIGELYGVMEEKAVFNMPIDKQIEFFQQQELEFSLPEWIAGLRDLIIRNSDLRFLGLSMLQIHAQLAYYISCIQIEDVNKADVKMANSLNALADTLRTVLRGLPNFSEDQRRVAASLKRISETESANVKNNNEENSKPFYVRMLNLIIRMFE